MNRYLLLSPILVMIGAFLPWRRERIHGLEHLVRRVTPCRFRGLNAYLEGVPELAPGPEFWDASGRLPGVLQRFREMTLLVRILQHEVSSGHVSRKDAAYAWHQALLQIWFSVWAVPEAAVCLAWRGLPHVCGLFALRSHYSLSLRTVTLCGHGHAPPSIGLLTELL